MLSLKADPNIDRDSPDKHNTLIYAGKFLKKSIIVHILSLILHFLMKSACRGKIETAKVLINHGDLADETLANKGFFEKGADGRSSVILSLRVFPGLISVMFTILFFIAVFP